MKVEIEQIIQALSELVRLKDYKDKYGKDEHYVVEQPLAWNKAKVVIKQANEAKAKYKRDALIAFNEWLDSDNNPLYFEDDTEQVDYYLKQLGG